jgi:hypothetical protein
MGTRGLTAVLVDGAYRIAQYGQWDHYPDGQGVTVLDFLHGMDEPKFRAALGRCRWITEDEVKAMWTAIGVSTDGDGWVTSEQSARFHAQPKARLLTRNHGAKVLSLVAESDGENLLQNSIDFAGDSLMCEYAYVIDLDKRTFEVFKGFNEGPLEAGERFATAPLDGNGYQQVRLMRSFSLDELPTKAAFLEVLKSPDEDEE